MVKATEVTVEDLSAQVSVLKNDIATLTNTLTEYGKERGDSLRRQARDTASDLSSAGVARAKDAQAQAEDFVRTQPTAALGIAAGVGFIVGLLTVRR
jgi:ElaB/YqjD/DUF883 family membrane-anchored ribosome-binding protein